jgi:putative flippase GtrA
MANDRCSHLVRFLLVGGLNTAITYVVYLTLNGWMVPWLAYGAAYLLGIIIAFVGNRSWVFRSKQPWRTLVPYAAMQVALMGVGSLVSWLVTPIFPAWAIGLAAIVTVVPLSFLANAFFFSQTSPRSADPEC